MKKTFLIVLVFALTGLNVLAVQAQDAQTPAEICAAAEATGTPGEESYAEPEQVLEEGVDYRAIFCTESGPVYIDLYEDYAPITVNSFVFLAQEGYYDNTTFHRVIADFMAQGGDPTATGSGGPGYQFEDEFVGFLTFDVPGWLAMANAGSGTNGSQFFITTVPTTHLDFQHTIFGKVLEGQENVENLKIRDPQTATEDGSRLDTVVIITDPATVETTYEAPVSLAQDEVEAAFVDLVAQLSARYSLPEGTGLEDEVVMRTTDEVVAAAPEAIQSDYADYLASHNHEYSITGSIINTACDMDLIPFASASYTLDAYASADDAAAALADEFTAQFPLENGFDTVADSDYLSNPLFTTEVEACDGQYTRALTQWQRGHFVVTAEATIQPDYADVSDVLLSTLVGVQIFEYLVDDVLRAEIG